MFDNLKDRTRRLKAVATLSGALLMTTAFASLATLEEVAAQSKTVTLSSSKVIEVAYIDMKHGKRDAFVNDYFAHVKPIIEEYGGEVVAKFETFDVVEGNLSPQMVILFQWPTTEAFGKATKDQRLAKYLPIRKDALRSLSVGLYTIEKDVTIKLEEGVVYEFFAGNPSSPKAPELLGKFFQTVIPTAMEYGRKGFLDLKPVDYDGDNYNRMFAGVAIWPSAQKFYQFTNTTVFRDGIMKYRNPAINNQDIINTYYIGD